MLSRDLPPLPVPLPLRRPGPILSSPLERRVLLPRRRFELNLIVLASPWLGSLNHDSVTSEVAGREGGGGGRAARRGLRRRADGLYLVVLVGWRVRLGGDMVVLGVQADKHGFGVTSRRAGWRRRGVHVPMGPSQGTLYRLDCPVVRVRVAELNLHHSNRMQTCQELS